MKHYLIIVLMNSMIICSEMIEKHTVNELIQYSLIDSNGRRAIILGNQPKKQFWLKYDTLWCQNGKMFSVYFHSFFKTKENFFFYLQEHYKAQVYYSSYVQPILTKTVLNTDCSHQKYRSDKSEM